MSYFRFLPWLLLITLALIWGSSFILIKRGLEVYDAYAVGALRVGVAGLILAPFGIHAMRRLVWWQISLLVGIGLLGSMIPAILFPVAQQNISSSLSGVLNALTPLFVMLVARQFFAAPMYRKQTVGVLLGLIGTGMLFIEKLEGSLFVNYYALFAVLATVCYGININLIRHYARGMNSLAISSVSLCLMLPFCIAILWQRGFFELITAAEGTAPWEALGYIFVLGFFGTAVGWILFTYLVKIAGAIFSSSVTYLAPLVAIGWGLWDGETLSSLHYISVVCILTGVFLAAKKV